MCGCILWLVDLGDDLALHANGCNDRLCVPCQVAHRERLLRKLYAQHASKPLKFVTLTLKHQRVPLADQIDRLLACFKRLRQRPLWKRMVGGAWFLEIQRSPATRTWHPHVHVLVEGPWLDQKELAAAWHAVTGDSFIVHVRAVPDHDAALRYVTKYATKPAPSTVVNDPEALDEFVIAIKGRRLLQAFGTWKALDDDEQPDPDPPRRVGTLYDLWDRAREGDACARRWMEAAHRKWPALATLMPIPPPPPHVEPPPRLWEG